MAVVETTVTGGNDFLLRILDSGQLLRARSQLALFPGQILKLQVIEPGATPELKILPPETPVTPESVLIQQALRQHLPKQQGLVELASSLVQAMKPEQGAGAVLPDGLRTALQAVLDVLPQKDALIDPEGLRQAIRNSGLFFEAKLAALADGAEARGDLKGLLLALVDALKNSPAPPQTPAQDAPGRAEPQPAGILLGKPNPAMRTVEARVEMIATQDVAQPKRVIETAPPVTAATQAESDSGIARAAPERNATSSMDAAASGDGALLDDPLGGPPSLKGLLDKTEGALARLVLDQLASLSRNDSGQTAWNIQIPFTDGSHTDAAKLRIVRENKAGSQAEQAYWTVVLELNPPGLGILHSRITLVGGRIETCFWSGSEATSNLVRSHLDLLAARLQQAGLEVGRLDTVAGPPPDDRPESQSPPIQLVDERA